MSIVLRGSEHLAPTAPPPSAPPAVTDAFASRPVRTPSLTDHSLLRSFIVMG